MLYYIITYSNKCIKQVTSKIGKGESICEEFHIGKSILTSLKGTQYGSYLVLNAKNSWFCVFIEMLIFYDLINPRLVVSWWNLVAPGMAKLDHYYDFKHGKCSLKDFRLLTPHSTFI